MTLGDKGAEGETKMKIADRIVAACNAVRAWPEVRKERVRSVCRKLQKLNDEKSEAVYVGTNADFAFVEERCFPHGIDIVPGDVLELVK